MRLLTLIISLLSATQTFHTTELSASPRLDYANAGRVIDAAGLCDPEAVVLAIRAGFPVPPVDISVRGLDVRIPEALDDVGSYGMTRVSDTGEPRFHAGTDLLAEIGEPVVAVVDGEVVVAASSDSGSAFGNYVILRSNVAVPPAVGCAADFVYAHLSSLSVSANQQVTAGTVIGHVGRSGNVDADIPTHLHIEFWTRGYMQGVAARRQWTRDIMGLFGL